MTVKCPICEWTPDDDAENPENSVIAHMASSKGEHEGVGYQKARQKLDVEEAINGPADSDSGAADSSTDGGTDSNSETPAEHHGEDRDDEQETPEDTEASVTDSDAGLGLSGDNPFPDNSGGNTGESAPAEEASEQADGSGAWAVLGLVGVVGMALLGALKNSADSSDDGPDVV